MMMRSELLLGTVVATLATFSATVRDTFDAHRDEILAAGVAVYDGNVYIAGFATSPRSRGDAVGWTKAEEAAKWNLGDRFRACAPCPADLRNDEEDAAWMEYRSMHPNLFHVIGLQRVWTEKTPPDGYTVVMCAPAEFASLDPPTKQELAKAVASVRKKRAVAEEARRRAEAEAIRKAAEESAKIKAETEAAERKAGARKILPNGAVRQQQLDEDMIL